MAPRFPIGQEGTQLYEPVEFDDFYHFPLDLYGRHLLVTIFVL
jgi:hypothetical protein